MVENKDKFGAEDFFKIYAEMIKEPQPKFIIFYFDLKLLDRGYLKVLDIKWQF
jgi:hypothetical protein